MNKPTRVALVTSGGDCQGLNAAMRGVAKSLFEHVENIEIYGMYDGYRGLIERDYKFMEPKDFSGILTEGGTILGTSRQRYVPGKDIVDEAGNSLIPAMLDTYNRLISTAPTPPSASRAPLISPRTLSTTYTPPQAPTGAFLSWS